MPKSGQIFITATDTGVGKTLVSGLLLHFLLKQGVRAGYQKWVATGVEKQIEDLDRVLDLAGQPQAADELDQVVPCRLPYPASPHLAAELAGQEIDPAEITRAYEKLKSRYEVLLVEGVGGLMVPLRRDLLLADLLGRLQISTLLVARSGLGTLNHTLLSLEALRKRSIPVLGVLLTDGPAEDETVAADNLETIAAMGRVRVFGRLPWRESTDELQTAFRAIGREIGAAI